VVHTKPQKKIFKRISIKKYNKKTYNAVAHHPRQGFEPVLLDGLCAGQNHRTGAVANPAGVPARHRAVLLEDGTQLLERGKVRAGARVL
jgi:hypothetical protein